MLSYKYCKMSGFKQETDNYILNVPLHFLHNKHIRVEIMCAINK